MRVIDRLSQVHCRQTNYLPCQYALRLPSTAFILFRVFSSPTHQYVPENKSAKSFYILEYDREFKVNLGLPFGASSFLASQYAWGTAPVAKGALHNVAVAQATTVLCEEFCFRLLYKNTQKKDKLLRQGSTQNDIHLKLSFQ